MVFKSPTTPECSPGKNNMEMFYINSLSSYKLQLTKMRSRIRQPVDSGLQGAVVQGETEPRGKGKRDGAAKDLHVSERNRIKCLAAIKILGHILYRV